jgi:triacylglycerol lipase
MERQHVLLVPGFFGFANLGDLAYFAHVRDALVERCRPHGILPHVRVVHTIPTASLRRRAARLAETLQEALAELDAPVHLVGHSSGGLDTRLVVTPGVSLPTAVDVEACVCRVRSVLTLATPHHGTPTAGFFASLLGQQLLRVLSLATMYVLRSGRLPISAVLQLAGVLVGPTWRLQAASTALDQVYRQLLADFSEDRRLAIEAFIADVGGDTDLVPQLVPAAMDLFNAATIDRPGLRYGSVVIRARTPGLRSTLNAGPRPYVQATHALYAALYRLAARTAKERRPPLAPEQAAALRRAFGEEPDARANDGIVPTLSQVWGQVVHAAWADHLDVIGHFDHPTHVPPHFDWLTSGTGFERADFDALWDDVAAFVAAAAAAPSAAAAAR